MVSLAKPSSTDNADGGELGAVDIDELVPRLWGNIYFNEESRKFSKKPADPETKRSFVHFILEPLYKLYTQVCSMVLGDHKY
jgi:hypothetical protein